MPKPISVTKTKKPGKGRKPYKNKAEFATAIQFYRKGAEIELLGGMAVVRAFSEAEFDRRLAKVVKK